MQKPDLRVFTGRPHDNIVQSYGAEFAAALAARTPGEWRALPSRDGLRVMRLEVDHATAAGHRSKTCAASCFRTGRMR